MSKERRNKGKQDDQRGRKGGSQRNNSGQRSEKREGNENKTGCFRCGKSDHLQRNALLTKRDPLPNAEIAGWITQLESAGTDVSQITRKLRRRKIRNSKDCERLKDSLMNILVSAEP